MSSHTTELLLMRHADAAPRGHDEPDARRPLTEHGRRRAAARADLVDAYSPQVVLCSTAQRAIQTLEALRVSHDRVEVDERLYRATAAAMVLRLGELSSDVTRVMVIGHLPTVGQVASTLIADEVALTFDPATVVVLGTTQAWADLAPGCAALVAYHP